MLVRLAAAAFVYVLAFAVRLGVMEYHTGRHVPGRLPYTLEGALQYHYAERVAAGARIPEVDPRVEWPDGLHVREALTTGPMILSGTLYRWSGRDIAGFHEGQRRIAIAFASLSAPAVFAWAALLGASAGWSTLAGVAYAVMPAAVIRSSGLEFMGEYYGLPFVFLHLALFAGSLAARGRRRAVFFAWGGACALAAALWLWDMAQAPVYLLAAWLWWEAIRGRSSRAQVALVIPQIVAVVFVGAVTPYGRHHGIALSPAVVSLAGWCVAACFAAPSAPDASRRRFAFAASAIAVCTAGVAFLAWHAAGAEAYGHFGRLILAKLRFANVKPSDPALLPFEARILWVPALHSATLALTLRLFPATLPSSLALRLGARLRRPAGPQLPDHRFSYFLLWWVLFLYALMVRFHVLLAGVAACVACVTGCRIVGSRPGWRWPVTIAAMGLLTLESLQTIGLTPWMGRRFAYYPELDALIANVRESTPEDAVILASFGVSPALMHYADRTIILHPKFETQRVRDRVEAYARALFAGDEAAFRDYCDSVGASHYVYSLGEFSNEEPRYTLRYCAGVPDPVRRSAARRMEFEPDGLRWFRLLESNRKYRLFEVIGPRREAEARRQLGDAREALARGDLDAAYEDATRAVEADPRLIEAMELMDRVIRLHQAGFGRPAGEAIHADDP